MIPLKNPIGLVSIEKKRGISSSPALYCIITGEIEVIFSVLLFLFKINFKF